MWCAPLHSPLSVSLFRPLFSWILRCFHFFFHSRCLQMNDLLSVLESLGVHMPKHLFQVPGMFVLSLSFSFN